MEEKQQRIEQVRARLREAKEEATSEGSGNMYVTTSERGHA
jgi:hypothetical protein